MGWVAGSLARVLSLVGNRALLWSISSWPNFESLNLEIFPFPLDFPSYCGISFQSIHLWCSEFFDACFSVSLFISNFINLCLFSCSFGGLRQRTVNLVHLLKKVDRSSCFIQHLHLPCLLLLLPLVTDRGWHKMSSPFLFLVLCVTLLWQTLLLPTPQALLFVS